MNAQTMDRAIEALARRQHGAFHRSQAIELGLTPRMIDRRRGSGAWLTLAPGVYALNSHPFSWLRQAKAAELSIRDAVVSHRSAAVVHGWEGFRPGRIELSVPVASRHDSPLAVVHRVAHLDRVARQGIAVTSAARTVVDLAGVLAPASLGRVIDDVLLAGLASIEQITAAFDLVAGGHPRGSGVLRDLLGERTEDGYVPSRNELEASLDTVLADPRIPPSVREAAFPWMPDEPYRVDALIPRWRRIVEVDGRRWHARVAWTSSATALGTTKRSATATRSRGSRTVRSFGGRATRRTRWWRSGWPRSVPRGSAWPADLQRSSVRSGRRPGGGAIRLGSSGAGSSARLGRFGGATTEGVVNHPTSGRPRSSGGRERRDRGWADRGASDAGVAAFPVGVAQPALVELAVRIAGHLAR